MKIKGPEDISSLYRGEQVPALDDEALLAITTYLRENGLTMQEGAVATDPAPATKEVLRLTKKFESLGERALFMGPYILEDKYYPNGIGAWGSNEDS